MRRMERRRREWRQWWRDRGYIVSRCHFLDALNNRPRMVWLTCHPEINEIVESLVQLIPQGTKLKDAQARLDKVLVGVEANTVAYIRQLVDRLCGWPCR
jgi:hypothetical protein